MVDNAINIAWQNEDFTDVLSVLGNLVANTIENRDAFKERLVNYSRKAGNLGIATNEINELMSNNKQELQIFAELTQLQIALKNENRSIYEMTNTEIAYIEQIANTPTKAGIKARNALLAINEQNAIYDLPVFPAVEERRINPFYYLLERAAIDESFISPNPAKDIVYLNLTEKYFENDILNLNIYNASGKLIMKEQNNVDGLRYFDISNFVEGIYLVEIINTNNNSIIKNKLKVKH